MLKKSVEVTAELVKRLREQTGVGMMDCKKALIEANGDLEEAATILRKKGVAIASKRAGNVTEHGVIYGSVDKDFQSGSLVEVGCETDFAAKTEDMQKFVKNISEALLSTEEEFADVTELLGLEVAPSVDVKAALEQVTAKIAEKISISNSASYRMDASGLVNIYIHPGSLLGTMIMIKGDKPFSGDTRDQVAGVAKDICMHIAVTNPKAINSDRLDKSVLDKEMDIARAQLEASGKPANIIDKILEGKAQKFYEEVCLVNQKFIKDEKKSIEAVLEECSKATNVNLVIEDFVRFQITGGK